MLTFLAIHFGSILLLFVWMLIENLMKKGNIDILTTIRAEAYKQNIPIRALWIALFLLPELVLVITILKIFVAIVRAILE